MDVPGSTAYEAAHTGRKLRMRPPKAAPCPMRGVMIVDRRLVAAVVVVVALVIVGLAALTGRPRRRRAADGCTVHGRRNCRRPDRRGASSVDHALAVAGIVDTAAGRIAAGDDPSVADVTSGGRRRRAARPGRPPGP